MANENLGLGSQDINSIYQSTFGRPAEQGGLDYWSSQLAANPGMDLYSSIRAGAQNADITARNDIGAGGVDTSTTWGNGASLDAPVLNYDASNNTWGKKPAETYQSSYTPAQNATLKPYEKSPYLDQMAGNITSQMNDNWSRNQLPSIRSGAMAAGGFGGSRQGVVEANGLNDMNRSLGQNLTSLYGGDYTNSMNRNLQQYGMDQNFNLGQNQQNLTNQSQMQNFYLGNRQLDQSGMQLGANLYNMGNSGNVAAGQGQAALGQQYQNAPLNALQQYSNTISPYSGLGGSQISTANSGGGAQGAIGGALAGAQIFSNLGFGSGSNTGGMAMTNGGGFSNMPNYMIQN